ncbi:hypothetical protein [Rodentibacter ratti]|nr:hypothetical protein [Rodentibacter ratti]
MNPQYAEGIIEDYDEFGCYSEQMEHRLDIVGLWENKPEPFNLERALAGEPVLLRNNLKAFVLHDIRPLINIVEYYPIIGVDEQGTLMRWNHKGQYPLQNNQGYLDIVGMWKEPEPVKSSADNLPKPIRELGDLKECWSIVMDFNTLRPLHRIMGDKWGEGIKGELKNGLIYATEEDCQAVCNWLMNR